MKRFAIDKSSQSMVTTADKIAAYEIQSKPSHASYTLDR